MKRGICTQFIFIPKELKSRSSLPLKWARRKWLPFLKMMVAILCSDTAEKKLHAQHDCSTGQGGVGWGWGMCMNECKQARKAL